MVYCLLWAVVAAVSFSAANVADAVPLVFQYALDELVRGQQQPNSDEARSEQLVLARKIREAVLQSGLLSGMPRVSLVFSCMLFCWRRCIHVLRGRRHRTPGV